ncbi:MAG: TonB family protein [Rhizomicrobium sp.]
MFQRIFADILKRAGEFRLPQEIEINLGEPRRYAAWAAVAILHIIAVWIIAANVIVPHTAGAGREMLLTLQAPSAPKAAMRDPLPDPTLQAADPAPAEPMPPQIDIDAAPGGSAISASADILPPRPDPAVQNPSPKLPAGVAKLAGPAQVTLKILVAANGAVTEAQVMISSGRPALDALAASFAKAKWHFRAATQSGEPVADWTTVIVRFLQG